MSHCLLSFGSNLGDRRKLVSAAAATLQRSGLFQRFHFSRLFETPPIGGPQGQAVFLNAVAQAETEAGAREILDFLQRTEQRLGRVRQDRWGARAIDLDLVLYGDWIGNDMRLMLPHPRFAARTFVLQPAMDVVPQWRDPRSGWTLQQLCVHLQSAPPSLAFIGGDRGLRGAIADSLASRHELVVVREPQIVPSPLIEPPSSSARGDALAQARAQGYLPDDRDSLAFPLPPADRVWVSDFVPQLDRDSPRSPRVIARLHDSASATYWPQPGRLWRNGWQWPEYQLEAASADAAAKEILAALDAMACPVSAITTDDAWSRESMDEEPYGNR